MAAAAAGAWLRQGSACRLPLRATVWAKLAGMRPLSESGRQQQPTHEQPAPPSPRCAAPRVVPCASRQVVCPHRNLEEAAMPLKQMGDLGQVVVIKGWSLGDDDMTRYAHSRSKVGGAGAGWLGAGCGPDGGCWAGARGGN